MVEVDVDHLDALANNAPPGTGGATLMNRIESSSTSRIATIADSRISMLPVITRFGPKESSSLPPSHAPMAPAMARRIPKLPIWIVCQLNVPAA